MNADEKPKRGTYEYQESRSDNRVCYILYIEKCGDHRDLASVDRRQRQVCIRGRVSDGLGKMSDGLGKVSDGPGLPLIHISEPTRRTPSSDAAFC